MDEEQPLNRRLFRMAVVLLLTTLLLATRGFGTFPENELSASLAHMLATHLPAPLAQALDGYLGVLGAPALAEVAANTSEASAANNAINAITNSSNNAIAQQVEARVVESDSQTTLQMAEVNSSLAVAKPQPSQSTPNANDANLGTPTSAIEKPGELVTPPPKNIEDTPEASATDAPAHVATEAIRPRPSATRKARAKAPTPLPQAVATPTPAPEAAPTPVPPPAPSGQTQTSATSTPDLPERVKATRTATQIAGAQPTPTPIPEPTLTQIPEIVETAIEPTPVVAAVATATAGPTALPSSTLAPMSPTETPQPTATEAATPTLAPTETQSPAPPTSWPTATPEATSTPTVGRTPEPERTKKPHPHATPTAKSDGA